MNQEYKPILVGQEDNNRIYFEYSEYLRLIKFAKAGSSEGSRGILLGKKTGSCVIVMKVLDALFCGDEGIESPIFTAESWGRISVEIKTYYPELEILGQYSTHSPAEPDRSDRMMQTKFFTKKSNLLFIFDAISNSELFYLFADGGFYFVNGFYFIDRFLTPIDLTVRENILRPIDREYELRIRLFDDLKKKIFGVKNIIAVSLILILVLFIYTFFQLERIDKELAMNVEKLEWNKELKGSEN